MRTVLVLGATSLVGRFALPRLVEAGFRVVALSRAPQPAMPGVEWTEGDLHDPGLTLLQVDAVLALAPIWLLPDALPALARTGATRLIAFSSTSAATKANSPVAAERAVATALIVGESRTRAFCEEAGIACTIFRPTMIYAEGRDGNVSRLASLIRRFGVLPLSGRGEGRRQPVHADDLAAACLQALDRPETHGRVYELPGGETLSYRAMVERLFDAVGRRRRIVAVPPPLWRLALALAAPLLPGATAAMGDRMGVDLVFDGEPARRDFGWAPRGFRPRF